MGIGMVIVFGSIVMLIVILIGLIADLWINGDEP